MNYLEIIKDFTEKAGISVSREQLTKLAEFHDILTEENQLVNLISRQSTCEDIWLRHILDSILILQAVKLEKEAVLDFGSGGGLPGIPLKILLITVSK